MPQGRSMLTVLGRLAEFERDLLIDTNRVRLFSHKRARGALVGAVTSAGITGRLQGADTCGFSCRFVDRLPAVKQKFSSPV